MVGENDVPLQSNIKKITTVLTSLLCCSALLSLPTTQGTDKTTLPTDSMPSAAVAHNVAPDVLHEVVLPTAQIQEMKRNQKDLAPQLGVKVESSLMNNHQLRTLKDLTAVVPNFYMPDYGSKQNSPLYIRGIGAKAKAPTAGFYVDGVPHFEGAAFDFLLDDVRSVEVLRGAQGALYGRNAIGGIVNVQTFSPFDRTGTRLRLGYGNFKEFSANLSTQTTFNNRWGVALSAGAHNRDGYFKNKYTNQDADALKERYARVGVEWRANDRWTMRLNSMVDYTDQGGYPYGVWDKNTQHVNEVNYNHPSGYERLLNTNGLRWQYVGKGFDFNSQTSYQYLKDHQTIDQDFTPKPYAEVDYRTRQNLVSQEFSLKSNTNSRYQWMFGLFGMSQWVKNNIDVANNMPSPKTKQGADLRFVTDYLLSTQTFAFYHQSSYNVWRGLSLTAALRYDFEQATDDCKNEKSSLSTRKPLPNGNQNWVSKLHFSQLTPKFAVQYRWAAADLYAQVTRGYKAGGFNQTFRYETERTFLPETNWSYEVGTHFHLPFWATEGLISLYYTDWRDQQVALTVPGVGNILHNAGHSDSKGWEASVRTSPIKGLVLRAAYGYNYARFIEYKQETVGAAGKPAKVVDYAHHIVPLTPRHTLSAMGDYTVEKPLNLMDRLTFSVGTTALGRIYWHEDNEAQQHFYALLDAKVRMEWKNLGVELWGKNLTSTKYVVYGFKFGANYAQAGRPLTFGCTLNYQF